MNSRLWGFDLDSTSTAFFWFTKTSKVQVSVWKRNHSRECSHIFLDNEISWIRTIMGGSAPTNISSKRFFFLAWQHDISSGRDDLQEILLSKRPHQWTPSSARCPACSSEIHQSCCSDCRITRILWRDWLTLVIQLSIVIPNTFHLCFLFGAVLLGLPWITNVDDGRTPDTLHSLNIWSGLRLVSG